MERNEDLAVGGLVTAHAPPFLPFFPALCMNAGDTYLGKFNLILQGSVHGRQKVRSHFHEGLRHARLLDRRSNHWATSSVQQIILTSRRAMVR